MDGRRRSSYSVGCLVRGKFTRGSVSAVDRCEIWLVRFDWSRALARGTPFWISNEVARGSSMGRAPVVVREDGASVILGLGVGIRRGSG